MHSIQNSCGLFFWEQKMATTKCHFSYPAISTGKKQHWFHVSITIFYQGQMIRSNAFHVFCLGAHFFDIRSILNIKTCSFHFHFPSVLMLAKKTSVRLLFFSFTDENAFVLHSFKNTSVCTNSYEKNRNDTSEEK